MKKMVASMADLGVDFETYIGANSGSFYRLDCSQIHYHGKSREELLTQAREKEGELSIVGEVVKCKLCQAEFQPPEVAVDHEETIEAFDI